jgi:hypothetical protein
MGSEDDDVVARGDHMSMQEERKDRTSPTNPAAAISTSDRGRIWATLLPSLPAWMASHVYQWGTPIICDFLSVILHPGGPGTRGRWTSNVPSFQMNSYCFLFDSKLVFFRPQDECSNGSEKYMLAGVIDVRFDVTDPCLLESALNPDQLQFSVHLAGSRDHARRVVFEENGLSKTCMKEWGHRLMMCKRQGQPTSGARNSFLLSPVRSNILMLIGRIILVQLRFASKGSLTHLFSKPDQQLTISHCINFTVG